MAYVALSRAVSLEGLWLRGYSVSAIRAHPDVERFYLSLHRRVSAGSASPGSAAACIPESLALSLAETARQVGGEEDDPRELDTSFGSIDWQAVDLTRIDQQTEAAVMSGAVNAETQLVAKSHVQSEPECENVLFLKRDTTNDKNETAAAAMPSRVWSGMLRISTAGTYRFASYGAQPFSLILAGSELLNNASITRAKVSLLPGQCSLQILDGGAVGESVPQELAWTPDPSAEDTEEEEPMATLWRRGGYWAVGGECAPPLVEID